MATPSPIARVSVGKSGYGSAHAAYITRMSALDPQGRAGGKSGDQPAERLSLFALDDTGMREPTVRETLEDSLSERGLAGAKEHGAGEQNRGDPIWTWNAPDFLTGDGGRDRSDAELREGSETRGVVGDRRDKLTLKEKYRTSRTTSVHLKTMNEGREGGLTTA
jgi:hypothetical protein